MKFGPLLLGASLLANVALGVLLVRQSPGPTTAETPKRNSALKATAPTAAAAKPGQSLEEALASGDSAALLAAGVSPDIIRALTLGRAFDRLQDRLRQLREAHARDPRYWRNARNFDGPRNRAPLIAAQREFSDAVRQAYGFSIDEFFSERDARYSYLSPEKRATLQRIEQDYDEMMSQVYADVNGLQLPADREKLKLLRAERERDIAAAMSPAEREQFELHDSPAARDVMYRYGVALDSEEDFKRVVALQKAFNDRYGNNDGQRTPEQMKDRRTAEAQLRDQILASFSPEQQAALKRANDADYRTLNSLAQRLNLPGTVTDSVLATRNAYATQSMAINANTSLTEQERRAQLQALATRAQADLRNSLGADGAQAFAERAIWISMLKNGAAFSTNPRDGNGVSGEASVVRVPPPGARRSAPVTSEKLEE